MADTDSSRTKTVKTSFGKRIEIKEPMSVIIWDAETYATLRLWHEDETGHRTELPVDPLCKMVSKFDLRLTDDQNMWVCNQQGTYILKWEYVATMFYWSTHLNYRYTVLYPLVDGKISPDRSFARYFSCELILMPKEKHNVVKRTQSTSYLSTGYS